MHAVYCTAILCLTILVSCQIEEEQPPQDLSSITEEVFHQIAVEVIREANELVPPPPPPVPPQKDTAHQSDIEETMRNWEKSPKHVGRNGARNARRNTKAERGNSM